MRGYGGEVAVTRGFSVLRELGGFVVNATVAARGAARPPRVDRLESGPAVYSGGMMRETRMMPRQSCGP